MSDEVVLSYRGRQIRESDVRFPRDPLARHPKFNRKRLSLKVRQAWNWVQRNGSPRDWVCRGLMLVRHRGGPLGSRWTHPLAKDFRPWRIQ